MRNYVDNNTHNQLLNIAVAIEDYLGDLEMDLLEKEIGGEDSYEAMAEKAGFCAALQLFYQELSGFMQRKDFETQCVIAVHEMSEETAAKYNKENILEAPEILNHCLNVVREYTAISVDRNLNDILIYCATQLRFDDGDYDDAIILGAKETFQDWIKDFSIDDIEAAPRNDPIVELEKRSTFTGPKPQFN